MFLYNSDRLPVTEAPAQGKIKEASFTLQPLYIDSDSFNYVHKVALFPCKACIFFYTPGRGRVVVHCVVIVSMM